MPLSLGAPVETARPQLVTWDPEKYEETQEARKRIDVLIARGFTIDSEEDGETRLIPPKMKDHHSIIRILSQNGDDVVVWDRRNPAEVRDAYKKFKELLDQGYTAYATRSDGSRGHRITDFNPGLEEIFFSEDATPRQIVAVPKTVPG